MVRSSASSFSYFSVRFCTGVMPFCGSSFGEDVNDDMEELIGAMGMVRFIVDKDEEDIRREVSELSHPPKLTDDSLIAKFVFDRNFGELFCLGE